MPQPKDVYRIYDANGHLVGNVMYETAVDIHGKHIYAIDEKNKTIRLKSTSPYSNGRSKAEAYLNQRMERVGIQNIGTEQNKKYTVKDAVSGKVIEELQATNDAEAISKVRNKYGSRADYSSTSHVILFQGSSQIYM